MLEHLHFIRPLWLLAMIPLAGLAWRVTRPGGNNPWQRVVDARLLPLLMVGQAQRAKRSVLWLAAIGWTIAALALADPAWERKPQPVFKSNAARVVVLDLSSSMNASDLKPSRLVRARYKIEDVLSLGAEGQTGLVVYAGSAFTVTPLTRDANTIRSQLNALAPDLMPSDGSRADLGLHKAEELLRHAGLPSGQVLLVADGVAPGALAATEKAAAHLKADGYQVSVLAVGSPESAREPVAHDAADQASAIDSGGLRSIARAGGGVDLPVDGGIAALRQWVDSTGPLQAIGTEESKLSAQGWKEEGPMLVLLLLPVAALAFRRNWLLSLMLLPLLVMQPHEAMAATWSDLWQRPDQQSAAALNAGDYAKAAQLASDADRRGSAEYKRGNYQLALQDFSHVAGPRADYNRGNALAKLGRYPDALSAYDQALKADPDNADARANKAAVEALLKQQQAKADQDKAGQKKSPQDASGSQGDAKQGASGSGEGKKNEGGGKDKQGGGDDQGNSGKQASKDGQGGGSAADAQASPQPGTPPSDAHRGQSTSASGKGESSQQGASARSAGKQDAANTSSSAPAPSKPGGEFAAAAQSLATPGSATPVPGDASPSPQAGAAAPATQAAASNARRVASSATNTAQPLPTEEQLAAEQWLRRIPDDPGGLLRRKFLYQYRQQSQPAPADDQ